MNPIDRMISYFSASAGVKRAQARRVLAAYEAAERTRSRRSTRASGSINGDIEAAGGSLRERARHYDQNYDIVRGAITTKVDFTIGKDGISVEPQPRDRNGKILIDFARQIEAAFNDWSLAPEVTGRLDRAQVERLVARSMYRDGEAFAQVVEGAAPGLEHATPVRLSLELLEADYVPMISDKATGMVQGVMLDGWRRPVAYKVYKLHPGEYVGFPSPRDLKTIPAERMLHPRRIDRVGQVRGVSDLASVLNRIEDVKDYDESERIAAKLAAKIVGSVERGSPDLYDPERNGDIGESGARDFFAGAGMIFDEFGPGEGLKFYDSKRPNTNLEIYRDGQVRAIGAGVGLSFSSLAKKYLGTFSAQRQELIESWVGYGVVTADFISYWSRPVYRRFVDALLASGSIALPRDLDPATLMDAIYSGPRMPWIAPEKDAAALKMLEDSNYIAGPEIVRSRGGNPRDVLDNQAAWIQQKRERGLMVDSQDTGASAPVIDDEEDEANAQD